MQGTLRAPSSPLAQDIGQGSLPSTPASSQDFCLTPRASLSLCPAWAFPEAGGGITPASPTRGEAAGGKAGRGRIRALVAPGRARVTRFSPPDVGRWEQAAQALGGECERVRTGSQHAPPLKIPGSEGHQHPASPPSPAGSSQDPGRSCGLPCGCLSAGPALWWGRGCSGARRTQSLPCGKKAGPEKQPPLSLFSQVCRQAARQEGPLAARCLTDGLCGLPAGLPPPCQAHEQPRGLARHQVVLALGAPRRVRAGPCTIKMG